MIASTRVWFVRGIEEVGKEQNNEKRILRTTFQPLYEGPEHSQINMVQLYDLCS